MFAFNMINRNRIADRRYRSRKKYIFFLVYYIYFAYRFLRDFLTWLWSNDIKKSFIILISYIIANISTKVTSDDYNYFIITGTSHMATSTSKKELK